MTFVDDFLAGRVTAEQIDEYVEEWHSSDTGMGLHEYLGLTWDEYRAWVRDPDRLTEEALHAARPKG
jgi:hypothetical protein